MIPLAAGIRALSLSDVARRNLQIPSGIGPEVTPSQARIMGLQLIISDCTIISYIAIKVHNRHIVEIQIKVRFHLHCCCMTNAPYDLWGRYNGLMLLAALACERVKHNLGWTRRNVSPGHLEM